MATNGATPPPSNLSGIARPSKGLVVVKPKDMRGTLMRLWQLVRKKSRGMGLILVLPMLKPTLISVGVLEIMWIWNDYLLPYLVLDRTKYMTIPILIQYQKGSYGAVDLGVTMALILLSIVPIIIFYLTCQRHIIKGVAAGAVKG